MTGKAQSEKVERHFDNVADSWSNLYSDAVTFKRYNFLVRKRIVLDLLDEGGDCILDVGCGTGDFMPELLDRAHQVHGVDVAREMIERARARFEDSPHRARLEFSLGDVTNIEFPDDHFDAVIAVGLIEYLSDPDAALKEIFRVLKPGGAAILTVPNLASPFTMHDILRTRTMRFVRRVANIIRGRRVSPPYLHRHFLPWRVDARLRSCGFEVADSRYCTFGSFSLASLGPLFLKFSRTMERFASSPLGVLATNYVVKGVKR